MPDIDALQINGEISAPAEIRAEIRAGATIQVEILGSGPTGPAGPQGPEGREGPQGPQGEPGEVTESEFQNTLIFDNPSVNMRGLFTEVGAVYYSDGEDYNSTAIDSAYRRTPFLFVRMGTRIDINGLRAVTAIAQLAFYTAKKVYVSASSLRGNGAAVSRVTTWTAPADGYVRFSTTAASLEDLVLKNAAGKKTLNILCLGNSYSQDTFAYLPSVLNELLPDYSIAYGVAYAASAEVGTHIQMYQDSTAYTWFNYWRRETGAWTRYAGGGGVNEKTLTDILGMEEWDIIYVQPTGGLTTANMDALNIAPGRQLQRLLCSLLGRPYLFLMGQWLAPQTSVPAMKTCMEYLRANLGVNAILPIGTGIANARSNSTLQVLGDDGDMLYDGQHQQSGLPALISTYVLAQSLLRLIGEERRSVYGSSFLPTTENCIAINAYQASGMVSPLPMTHGDSVGVSETNVRAAQEIAILAVNNPLVITDCSSVIV